MKLTAVLSVVSAVAVIVGVAMGGRIYRWEGIVWPAVTIAWTITAYVYWRLSDD